MWGLAYYDYCTGILYSSCCIDSQIKVARDQRLIPGAKRGPSLLVACDGRRKSQSPLILYCLISLEVFYHSLRQPHLAEFGGHHSDSFLPFPSSRYIGLSYLLISTCRQCHQVPQVEDAPHLTNVGPLYPYPCAIADNSQGKWVR